MTHTIDTRISHHFTLNESERFVQHDAYWDCDLMVGNVSAMIFNGKLASVTLFGKRVLDGGETNLVEMDSVPLPPYSDAVMSVLRAHGVVS